MRRRAKARLLELDGPYCRWPGCPTWGAPEHANPDAEALAARFEINHVVDPAEHWLDEMELMHPACNRRAAYDPEQAARRARTRQSAPAVRESPGGGAPAGAGGWAGLHARVDYRAGSPEMQVNDDAEPTWENWFWACLRAGPLTKYEAINVGAHRSGWSVQGSRRAYEKRVWVPERMAGEHADLPAEEYAGEFTGGDGLRHRGRMVRLRAGWSLGPEGDGDGQFRLRPRRGAPG